MLDKLLNEKQALILKRWFHQIAETYPQEGGKFFESKKDQFNNPIGYIFSQEIEVIYRQLLDGMDKDILSDSLLKIIKIRNVQEFSASQVVSFIFLLKKAIRSELNDELADMKLLAELMSFEAKIDHVTLLAMDIYTGCRQSLYEIRFNELKRKSIQFLRQFENPESQEN